MKLLSGLMAAASVLAISGAPSAANAAFITLDFEGIGSNTEIGDYYNGVGGPNYGIQFLKASAAVEMSAGGTGIFANEPSPNSVMAGDDNYPILNDAAGFDTGFSFYYSSLLDQTVTVWSGLNGEGALLATISFEGNTGFEFCSTGIAYCSWDPIGVTFSGVAHSVNFGYYVWTAFDNVTIGSSIPTAAVPEPSTAAFLALGLAAIGLLHRRRPAC